MIRAFCATAVLCGTLMCASCLPLPLGDPGKSEVDSKLIGFWVDSDNADAGNMYVIAAFDAHCYVIQAVPYAKKDDHYETKSSAWRAWLTDVKGTRFITLQSVAQLAAHPKEGDKFYPTAKIVLGVDKLTFRGLEGNYPKFKGLKDSVQLAQVVAENLNDAAMYTEFETPLRRLDAGKEGDLALMKLAIPE